MISYELAKELKEAGFPQEKATHWYAVCLDKCVHCGEPKGSIGEPELMNVEQYAWYKDLSPRKFFAAPNLPELIEACGEEFESLSRRTEDIIDPPLWYAYMTERAFERLGIPCVVECDGFANGDTPEEAVKNLWLALKKK